MCVTGILESVSDITNNHETLRKDLTHVHQLELDMVTDLKYQMSLMASTLSLLNQRLKAKNLLSITKATLPPARFVTDSPSSSPEHE
jgi:hypothetical protein